MSTVTTSSGWKSEATASIASGWRQKNAKEWGHERLDADDARRKLPAAELVGEEGCHARQRTAAGSVEKDLARRGTLSRGAQDDATAQAVRMQEAAGIDVITDGEIRRESYFNRFANALGGIDIDNPAEVEGRHGTRQIVPRVIGEICRTHPVQVRDVEVLRALTDKPIKMTVPGPFTMMRLAKDEFYGDKRALLMAYAKVVNEEVHDYKQAGADIVQLDEPFMETFTAEANEFAVDGINRSLEGIAGTTVVHLCFGYAHYVKIDKPKTYSFLAPLNAS